MGAAAECKDYMSMCTNLVLPMLGGDCENMSYEDFQRLATSSQSERMAIARPTLLLTARDDPLHHVDMLGIGADVKSPNLVFMVTEEGGHVHFPTDLRGSSTLVHSVVSEFGDWCVEHGTRS